MLPLEEIEQHLKEVNELIPVHSMWDGFWIHEFDKNELTVTCSFDRMYYRDFDIFFKGVTFFNLPEDWRDTNVYSDELFRLSDDAEFESLIDDFEVGDKYVFALDLHYKTWPEQQLVKHTFFIVADDVSAERCLKGNSSPGAYYKEPFSDEPFPCFKNRVR